MLDIYAHFRNPDSLSDRHSFENSPRPFRSKMRCGIFVLQCKLSVCIRSSFSAERCGNGKSVRLCCFLVFCIHFNLYDHSNCVISTEDPRNYHFHSVLLTETVQGLVLCFCALHGWKYMSKYKKTAVWPLAFCIAPLVSDEYSIFYGVHSVSYFHWFTFTLRISNVVKRLLNSSENKSYVTVWDTVKYSSLKFTFLLTRQ